MQPDDLGGAQTRTGDQSTSAPAEDSLFRLVAGLVEDLQKVRLGHANRIRSALPRIPETIKPPRGVPNWEALFKQSSEAFEEEEHRLVKLGKALLEADDVGRWLLAQQGLGPALALRILGRVHPLSNFRRVRGLYAYCGLDVTVDKEGRSVGVNRSHPRMVVGEDGAAKAAYKWDWKLKVALFLFGQSLLKSKGPWRDLYDARKPLELAKVGLGAGVQTRSDDHLSGELGAEPHIKDDGRRSDEVGADAGDAQKMNGDHAGHEPPAKGLRAKAHHRTLRYVQKRLLRDLWRVGHGEVAVIDGGAEWPHGDPFQAVK